MTRGGAQGESQQVGASSSAAIMSKPVPGFPLAKSELPAASAFEPSLSSSANAEQQSPVPASASLSGLKDVLATTTVPTASAPAVSTTQASSSVPAQVVVVKPATSTAATGEAQKNGEVKYSEATKKTVVAEEVGSLSGFKLGLAPIAWGGNMTEALSRSSNSSGQRTLSNTQQVELRMATFIWQPWLSRVRSSIGLSRSKNTSYSGNSNANSSTNLSVTGSVGLGLLPRSRFPFDVTYGVSDRRAEYTSSPMVGSIYKTLDVRQSYRPLSGASTSTATYGRIATNTKYTVAQGDSDTVASRWTLRHDYRPSRSNSRYGVGYDRNIWNSVGGGGNASWGMQGNYSTSFGGQSYDVDAHRTASHYKLDGADLSSSGMGVRHGYRPHARFSVNSSANVEQTAMRTDNSYNMRYLQASTGSYWQPDPDLPFYVNTGGRLYDSSYERLGVLHSSQNQIASAGARYAHSRNISYSLDGSVANSKSDGTANRAYTENGSVNYTADVIKFGDTSYNKNANASVAFQSSTSFPSNRTVTAGVGHGLNIPYLLDQGAALNLTANESLLANNDRINGQNRTLSHTGGANWRPATIAGSLSGGVNANVSDIRSVGGNEKFHNQAASLGVDVVGQASANSSMRAAAAMQWASNGLGQYSSSANANLNYKHLRVFDVKGLRYELLFNLNQSQSRDRNSQDSPVAANSSLDQNIDYGIGRANVRLSLALAKYGKARSQVLMLHLGRSFGRL